MKGLQGIREDVSMPSLAGMVITYLKAGRKG